MTRRALLVLGMHRGGTSALAGTLVRLGAASPKTLMGPTAENPRGHWESWAFCHLHDGLLAAARTSWSAWTRIAPEWLASAAAEPFADQLPGLIDQEFGDAPFFVVKDPRICRIVPFWLTALASARVAVSVVIVMRNPMEVARSLESRDGLPVGLSLLMWLRHMLDAEFDTRGTGRCVVLYDDLLADWRAVTGTIVADTGMPWPSAADEDVADFLTSDLRHHSAAWNAERLEGPLSTWIDRTGRALRVLGARDAEHTAEALRTLDQVRGEFDPICEVFRPAAEDARARLSLVSAEHRREEAASSETILSLRAELEAARNEVRRLDEARDADRRHAEALHKLAATRQSAIEQLGREIEATHTRVDELCRERQRLQADSDELGRARERLQMDVDRISLERADLRATVDAMLASGSWRITAPLRGIWRLLRMGLRLFVA